MTIIEEWRPVVGYEGFYEVSNRGQVRSLSWMTKHWQGGQRTKPARMLAQVPHWKGYFHVSIRTPGEEGKAAQVHRLVAAAFMPKPSPAHQVNHKDGDKHNNNIENLEWVTQRENTKHAYENGLCPRGERHPKARLNPEAVRRIRALRAEGTSLRTIAANFGISRGALHNIFVGKSWRHVL